MRLSDDAIREFQQIHEEETGERLSLGAAQLIAQELLELYALLARPLPGEGERMPPECGHNSSGSM